MNKQAPYFLSGFYFHFNGHMMQRGILNIGSLEFFTPITDLVVTVVTYSHNTIANKMTVRVTVANEGDAGIAPPIPVKVYKTINGVRSFVATQNITTAISAGQVKNLSIEIASYSTHGNVEKLDVEVEIPGGQYDCKPGNNFGSQIPNLKAVNDEALTNVNQNITIPVVNNDDLGSCTTSNIGLNLIGTPAKGSATVSGKQILYTPMANNIGNASFDYQISCEGNTSTAKVYIGTSSTVRAEFVKDAKEPNVAGEIRLRFSDNSNITCDYPVDVSYSIKSPSGLANGTHYTVTPHLPQESLSVSLA